MDGERGGSSLHCSRWNPNVIYKGASHYLACICLTHTSPVGQHVYYTRTQAKPAPSTRATWRCIPFTVCGIVSTWRPVTVHHLFLLFSGNRSSNLPRNCKVTLGAKFIRVCKPASSTVRHLAKRKTRDSLTATCDTARRTPFFVLTGERYCGRTRERERKMIRARPSLSPVGFDFVEEKSGN